MGAEQITKAVDRELSAVALTREWPCWRVWKIRPIRILGIPVSDDDARRLIATLLAEGTPDALTAAAQITKGVERDLYAVGLTREKRAATTSRPSKPPPGHF